MQQEQIMQLLTEAASIGIKRKASPNFATQQSVQRISAIQVELTKDMFGSRQGLVDMIYVSTLEHRPEHLPLLFPLFAALCGERESNMLLANIDWQLLPQP